MMNSQKGARSKLADVLADIKNSRADDEYDYNSHEVTQPPVKRRSAVNYAALSGLTPRQSRSSTANAGSTSHSNHHEPKTPQTAQSTPKVQTYVLKLFDRTIDLAQFSSSKDSPLYPICRAWVYGHGQNQPSKTEETNGSPRPLQQDVVSGDPSTDVYTLPPAKSKLETMKEFNLGGDKEPDKLDIRIPESVRNFKPPECVVKMVDELIDTQDHQEMLELNKIRWKEVRNDWRESRKIHESRYHDSFKILNEMFLASQRGAIMDTPPAIEAPFEDESILERIIALNEMFPERMRTVVGTTVSKSTSCLKSVYSATRIITWLICSTAAILVLPISLETERQEYEQQMKRQERSIVLGTELGPSI